MKKYWELFIAFARVGVMTFGGGYAMIPILERELIDKRGWTTMRSLWITTPSLSAHRASSP